MCSTNSFPEESSDVKFANVGDYIPKTPLPSKCLIDPYALKNALRKWGPFDVASAIEKFISIVLLNRHELGYGSGFDLTKFFELVYQTDQTSQSAGISVKKAIKSTARRDTEILKFLFQYHEFLHGSVGVLVSKLNKLFIELPTDPKPEDY